PVLGACGGTAPSLRGEGSGSFAVPATAGQKRRVFHRVPAEDLRIPYGLWSDTGRAGEVDVGPAGNRPKAERNGACSSHRPEGGASARRCSWLPWTGGGQPPSPA